jgi:hypothetical protein
MKYPRVSCQHCSKDLAWLCNAAFPWLPQIDTIDVALVCAACRRTEYDNDLEGQLLRRDKAGET